MTALTSTSSTASAAQPTPRAGLALLVVATAQLMLVLDDTIANIALPSIRDDLGVPTWLLPWIVSASVLAFGAGDAAAWVRAAVARLRLQGPDSCLAESFFLGTA